MEKISIEISYYASKNIIRLIQKLPALKDALVDGCYFCERKGMLSTLRDHFRLEIHHIDTNRKNNDIKNLVVLCQTCHMRLHKKIYKQLGITKGTHGTSR